MSTDRLLRNLAAVAVVLLVAQPAAGDEGGVSFWLPGQFGSFAAVPAAPGWSLGAVYYHASTNASGNKQFVRGGRIDAGLDVTADLLFLAPSYAFAEPVLGGQLGLQVTGVYGRAKVDTTGTLTGPGGTALTGAQSDSNTGVGDLYPMASLKWNRGVHNFMAYAHGRGSGRLLRQGSPGEHRHQPLGAGPRRGLHLPRRQEGPRALRGVRLHLQLGEPGHELQERQQLAPRLGGVAVPVGDLPRRAGGILLHQLSGDSGNGATLGGFKSQVAAIGPQAGHFFPVGGQKWYVNLKGCYEFDAKYRPEGWNVWLTLAIPLSPVGK